MRSVTLALIIAGCGSIDSMPYKPPVTVEPVVMPKPAACGPEALGSFFPDVYTRLADRYVECVGSVDYVEIEPCDESKGLMLDGSSIPYMEIRLYRIVNGQNVLREKHAYIANNFSSATATLDERECSKRLGPVFSCLKYTYTPVKYMWCLR